MDCEIPQYYVCKEPVARQEHDCCECSAKILKGEKYLQVNACWDGRPDTFRQHLLCAEACMLIRDSGMNDDECVAYGELWTWWSESRHEWFDKKHDEARRKLWRMMLQITRRERRGRAAVPA